VGLRGFFFSLLFVLWKNKKRAILNIFVVINILNPRLQAILNIFVIINISLWLYGKNKNHSIAIVIIAEKAKKENNE